MLNEDVLALNQAMINVPLDPPKEATDDIDQISENDLKTATKKKRLPSISVCIPCVPVHVQYLSDCFLSIINQTVLPEEVILVVSESTPQVEEQVKNLLKQFPAFGKELSFVCRFFSEQQHPGTNRNEAVKLATRDIILFIDADDLMCPVRVATAKNIFFDHPDIIGFMNFFRKTIKKEDESSEQFMERTFKACDALFQESLLWETPYDKSCIKPYQFTFDITFGQPTLKRTLFSEERYAYNSKKIVEDVDFIASLLPKHIDHLLIYERPLIFYMQCRSSHDNDPADNKKPLMFNFISDAPLVLKFPRESLTVNPIVQDSKTSSSTQH